MIRNFPVRNSSRCTVCSGSFGLVRYYSWQTATCSRKCVGRLRDRCESDRRWLTRAAPIFPLSCLSSGSIDETYQGMWSLNP
jgi:hypothetical protein